MQSRPGAGPQIAHHPPVSTTIPPTIGQLIPRLRAAINDIDIFQNMVAAGVVDSSMPNWDALLRQYSLLLGRINALSTNLTDLAPIVPPDEPYDPSAKPASLRQYILTPLNPLPPNPDPLVQGTFFESLNTMPLLDVQNHTSSLLSSAPWKSAEELKTMSRPELEGWKGDLERRLKKEETTAEALERFIEETAEEYDWELRVDKVDEDGEDDLFDEPPEEQAEKEVAVEKVLPNPREGWEVKDYVRFLDTGVIMA